MLPLAKKTLRWDCIRSVFQGVLDVEFRTVMLLIAIRVFDMPTVLKAVLTSIGFASMLITPITQQLVNRSSLNNMQATAVYFLLISITLLISIFSRNWVMFFGLTALSRIFYKQPIPLMISVYKNNYPKEIRGKFVGYAFTCMAFSGMIFSKTIGQLLDVRQNNFRWVLFLASICSLLCAASFLKIPAQKIMLRKKPPLGDNFKIIIQDKLFLKILIFYSFIAVANQMTTPLRIEYLANYRYGFHLSNQTVLLLTSIVPMFFRIFSSPFWGHIYDRFGFIVTRQMVTLYFLMGIPLFFVSHNILVITIVGVFLGIGSGGGGIIWSLWVSKIAPKERLNEYMSADTAVIGLRDSLAPSLGYILLSSTSHQFVGILGFLLLLIALFGFHFIGKDPDFNARILRYDQD